MDDAVIFPPSDVHWLMSNVEDADGNVFAGCEKSALVTKDGVKVSWGTALEQFVHFSCQSRGLRAPILFLKSRKLDKAARKIPSFI